MVYDTFTAANSESGFYSLFEDITGDRSLSRVYLIKGGPGSGKSTLMKRLAESFTDETVERIHCSSDPKSLDGVFLRDRGIAVVDATAPHSRDMTVPGAFESLIDLSRFWDERRLAGHREQIAGLFARISAAYKPVYSWLRAAGALDRMRGELIEGYFDDAKAERYAARTVREHAYGEGRAERRFLSEAGGVRFSADALCDGYVVIDGEPYAADRFLRFARAELEGTAHIAILSPLCPERRMEGLILKKARLGIFLSSAGVAEDKVIKHINARAFIDGERRAEVKNKLAFAKKLTAELTAAAAAKELSEIKALHDELEKYYVAAMDFEALNGYTEEIIDKIKRES